MRAERNTDTFQVVRFDEGGEQVGKNGDRRLVCSIKGDGKIAIWGSKDNRHNIETVLKAGIPCTVECDTIPPNEWGEREYDHKHWLPEHHNLRVL